MGPMGFEKRVSSRFFHCQYNSMKENSQQAILLTKAIEGMSDRGARCLKRCRSRLLEDEIGAERCEVCVRRARLLIMPA